MKSITARTVPTVRDYAWTAFGVWSLSINIPPGSWAFVALRELTDCLKHPATTSWGVALSWLANPAAWAGIFLLGIGANARAAIAGQLAILLSLFAVDVGYFMPTYYVWLASMVIVVYAAMRRKGVGDVLSVETKAEPLE